MSEKLRECPFCGEAPRLEKGVSNDFWSVVCCGCGVEIEGMHSCSKEDGIAAWNHRPTEDALRAENDRLQKRVGELEGEKERYKTALENICEHLNITIGGAALVSPVYVIAYKALTPPATKEGE